MALQVFRQDNFTGGISEGSKSGYKGSFNNSLGLDFRTDPDKLQVMPMLVRDSDAKITDFVRWGVELAGTVYFYGNTGRIYKRNSTQNYSLLKTVSSSTGQGIAIFNDELWYAGNTNLGKSSNFSTFSDNYFVTVTPGTLPTDEGDKDINSTNAHGDTYQVPTGAISEAAANLYSFIPNKYSFAGINFWLQAKGTATVILFTLHDSQNNTIWSQNFSLSSATSTAYNRVTPSPNTVILVPGATYHIHAIVDTGTTTTIGTTVNNDLSTMSFQSYFRPLENNTTYHPMAVFLNKLAIGNGRFLCTVDDSEILNNEALAFPKGEQVRCLETIGDYLAIATTLNVDQNQDPRSRIYFWDGLSTTYNSFIDVDGGVHSIRNIGNNTLFILHGSQLTITAYTGGITPIRRVKSIGQFETGYINEGATNVWENMLIFGLDDGGTTEIDRAVYTYGRKSKDYPMALNKDFLISTGNTSGVAIGCIVSSSSDTLFISWYDSNTSTYGIDQLLTTSQQDLAYFETLRFDNNLPNLEKLCKTISVRTLPLNYGQTVTVYYRINNSEDWTLVGEMNYEKIPQIVYKSFPLDVRFFEIEFRVELATETEEAPTLLSFEMLFDSKTEFQLDSV